MDAAFGGVETHLRSQTLRAKHIKSRDIDTDELRVRGEDIASLIASTAPDVDRGFHREFHPSIPEVPVPVHAETADRAAQSHTADKARSVEDPVGAVEGFVMTSDPFGRGSWKPLPVPKSQIKPPPRTNPNRSGQLAAFANPSGTQLTDATGRIHLDSVRIRGPDAGPGKVLECVDDRGNAVWKESKVLEKTDTPVIPGALATFSESSDALEGSSSVRVDEHDVLHVKKLYVDSPGVVDMVLTLGQDGIAHWTDRDSVQMPLGVSDGVIAAFGGASSLRDSGCRVEDDVFETKSLRIGQLDGMLRCRNGLVETVNSTQFNLTIGEGTGRDITSGSHDMCLGHMAGSKLTEGSANVLIGSFAGGDLSDGSFNVFVGPGTGANVSTGTGNIAIGEGAGPHGDRSNTICFGKNARATGDGFIALGSEDAPLTLSFSAGHGTLPIVAPAGYINVNINNEHVKIPFYRST